MNANSKKTYIGVAVTAVLLMMILLTAAHAERPHHVVAIEVCDTVVNQAGENVTVRRRYGTGIQISRKHVLTASHVLDGAQSGITVRSPGNYKVDASVLGSDAVSDLALLKLTEPHWINAPQSTAPVLGSSVRAYGYGGGEGLHVFDGIVSYFGVTSDNDYRIPVIKTSARVWEGFSGGALMDARGNWLGIVTHRLTRDPGYSLAIDADTARFVAGEIRSHGYVDWPSIGVSVVETLPTIRALSIDVPVGLQVVDVDRRELSDVFVSASYDSYLGHEIPLGGDVITKINRRSVASLKEAREVLWTLKGQRSAELTVVRNRDQNLRVTVRLRREENPGTESETLKDRQSEKNGSDGSVAVIEKEVNVESEHREVRAGDSKEKRRRKKEAKRWSFEGCGDCR